MKMPARPRHFLNLCDLQAENLRHLLHTADLLKKNPEDETARHSLDGQILALIFESPSTRTRVSFDVAMRQLGGQTMVLSGQDMQIGRGESLSDTARVMSRYIDAIMIRILDHAHLEELAHYATVPVINGLTRQSHPCQVVADLLTYQDYKGAVDQAHIAYVGDWNNMVVSWAHASQLLGFELHVAIPQSLMPEPGEIEVLLDKGAKLVFHDSAEQAVKGADCVMTDTWVSMGDSRAEERKAILQPYQVNAALMSEAKKDAIFMHCLPAHRGDEVTEEVIDGVQSVVFDEAENRLHAQKAILQWCFNVI
jgi:ornithine carbamoyltransferase